MTLSATAEELETASNAVYERTRASYTIKGFAKGEADRAQIEADRGEHTFWYDAINDLMDRDVPALYEAAMAEHGFKAVDEPSYDLVSVKKDEGFVATATTPLQPELNLTQTTGFVVECGTPAVTDKEIDAVLERRRNAAAELVPHKGPAVKGNVVHMDFEGLLDGVAITGGEPLLRRELPALLRSIKELGYAVKLDTNGSHPEALRAVVATGLVDYVAMDIKNSPAKYAATVGLPGFDLTPVRQSAALLLEGTVDYEFRTTAVAELHDDDSFREIAQWIAGAKRYYIQCFIDRDSVLRTGLHAPDKAQLERWADIVRPLIPSVELRGV